MRQINREHLPGFNALSAPGFQRLRYLHLNVETLSHHIQGVAALDLVGLLGALGLAFGFAVNRNDVLTASLREGLRLVSCITRVRFLPVNLFRVADPLD